MKPTLLALGFICTLFYPSKAQPPQNIADGLQQILEAALPTNFTNPGAVMGVVVPGEWSWYGAAGNGISGMTAGYPATIAQPNTRFRAGSITKTIVATCILKLEQDGFLSIDDPIDDYLRATLVNDTIQPSQTIFIRNLLNHTSGVGNAAANSTCQMDVLTNMTASHTLEESINCGASLGEQFVPGTAWQYSNTNYSILAMIIESVSGMSYADYLDQTIFQPLNMVNTEIPLTDEISGDHMGCYWNIVGLGLTDLTIIDATTYTGWADVVSNTADLIIFHQALLNNTIINATQVNKMKTIDAVADNYGFGLEFNSVDMVSYYGHYGEVGNTNAMFYCELSSTIAPNGYYFSYNFNKQGVPMITQVDVPLYYLLKGDLSLNDFNDVRLTVAPNPSSDEIRLDLDNIAEFVQLKIVDHTGKMVFEDRFWGDSKIKKVDLMSLKSGVYTLSVECTSGVKNARIQVL